MGEGGSEVSRFNFKPGDRVWHRYCSKPDRFTLIEELEGGFWRASENKQSKPVMVADIALLKRKKKK